MHCSLCLNLVGTVSFVHYNRCLLYTVYAVHYTLWQTAYNMYRVCTKLLRQQLNDRPGPQTLNRLLVHYTELYSQVKNSVCRWSAIQCIEVKYSVLPWREIWSSIVKCSVFWWSTIKWSQVKCSVLPWSVIISRIVKCSVFWWSTIKGSEVKCSVLPWSVIKSSIVRCSLFWWSTIKCS